VVEHHALDNRIVQQVVGYPFQMAPRTVLMSHAGLYRDRVHPGLGYGLGELCEGSLQVVGVDVLGGDGPDHLLGPVAQHPLDRRADVTYGPLGVGDHNNVERVLD
jgi:hypothetical protein